MRLNYLLRDIDPTLWSRVKTRAAADGMTIRQWVFRALLKALK